MERGFIGLDIAVLAVSDVAIKLGDEQPAQLVLDRVALAGHRVVARDVVPETLEAVTAKYLEWIADGAIDVVIVTAGTTSDVASEALAPMITKQMTGFADLFRALTFAEIGTAAMLVDAAAGQCAQTFVFVLPASIGAVRTALDKLLLPQLDFRTKPANLVMRMARHHAGALEVTGPVKTPWIVVKSPGRGSTTIPAVVASPPRQKRGTEPGTPVALSTSQRLELAALQARAHVSVSQRMAVMLETAATPRARPPTNPITIPTARPRAATRPQGMRSKTPTANMIVPLKPPAQVVPNAAAPLTSPLVAADEKVVATRAEVARLPLSDVALPPPPTAVDDPDESQIEDIEEVGEIVDVPRGEPTPPAIPGAARQADHHERTPPAIPRGSANAPTPTLPTSADLEPVEEPAPVDGARAYVRGPSGPIEDASMREAMLAAQQRAVTQRGTVLSDQPRSVAIVSRKRANRQRAIVGSIVALSAAAAVLLLMIARHRAYLAAVEPEQPRGRTPAVAVAARELSSVGRTAPPEPSELRELREPPPPPPPTQSLPPQPPQRRAVVAKQPTKKRPGAAKAAVGTHPLVTARPGCDEVSCVLERYRQACCARWKPAAPTAQVRGPLPTKIDRTIVMTAIAKVKPAVIKCGEVARVTGTVKLSVAVAPNGRVSTATVTLTPNAALGNCVAGVVRKATFSQTARGGTFSYPFIF